MSLNPFPNPQTPEAYHRHPLLPTPQELAELSRSLGPLIAPTPATPTVILHDQASAIGSPASGRAYGDHTHGQTAAAPVALIRTGTSAEGGAVTHTRSDHQHSTAALGWGEMGRFSATSDTAALATNTTTDLSVTFTADATRLYMVMGLAWFIKSLAEPWEFDLMQDGTRIETVGQSASATTTAERPLKFAIPYLPAAGSRTVAIRVRRVSGAGTIQLNGTVNALTCTRWLWVLDIGPR